MLALSLMKPKLWQPCHQHHEQPFQSTIGQLVRPAEGQSAIINHTQEIPLPSGRKETDWPSGLRRQIKALVRKGVSSNLTSVNEVLMTSFNFCYPGPLMSEMVD